MILLYIHHLFNAIKFLAEVGLRLLAIADFQARIPISVSRSWYTFLCRVGNSDIVPAGYQDPFSTNTPFVCFVF